MRRNIAPYYFNDDVFMLEDWLTEFGHLLRAHTNFCLMKFIIGN